MHAHTLIHIHIYIRTYTHTPHTHTRAYTQGERKQWLDKIQTEFEASKDYLGASPKKSHA